MLKIAMQIVFVLFLTGVGIGFYKVTFFFGASLSLLMFPSLGNEPWFLDILHCRPLWPIMIVSFLIAVYTVMRERPLFGY